MLPPGPFELAAKNLGVPSGRDLKPSESQGLRYLLRTNLKFPEVTVSYDEMDNIPVHQKASLARSFPDVFWAGFDIEISVKFQTKRCKINHAISLGPKDRHW